MKQKKRALFWIVLITLGIRMSIFANTNLPSGCPGTSKPIFTYTYNSTGTVTTFKEAGLKNKIGYISCATDDCRIIQLSGDSVKVNYPVSGGRKEGWCKRISFTGRDLTNDKAQRTFKAGKNITTYRWKAKSTTFGTIYKNDICYLLQGGYNADWLQILYPVSGGYKMAWVKGTDLYASSIKFDTGAFSLTVGSNRKINAVVSFPTDLDVVSWSSSNTGVAVIAASGTACTVKAVKEGKTTITGTTKHGKTASVIVTVNPKPAPTPAATAPTVSTPSSAQPSSSTQNSAAPAASTTTTATPAGVTPTSATEPKESTQKPMTSTSGNTVSSTDTSKAKTTVSVTGVKMSIASKTIKEGANAKISVAVIPSNATNKKVNWSSSNVNVASVDSNGCVRGKKSGTANIIVKTADGGKKAICKIKVTKASKKIPINKKIKVFSQNKDKRWKNYPYGYASDSDEKKKNHATIMSGGCGVLSVVNAVYYLNNTFINPK